MSTSPNTDGRDQPVNLLKCAMVLQLIERLTLQLPPIHDIKEALEAYELHMDRKGDRPTPGTLEFFRPVLEAAEQFQTALAENQRRFDREDPKPEVKIGL